MLFGIPIGDFTAPGLLGIAIACIIFGLLVPRPFWMDKEKEARRWEAAYKAEAEAHAITRGQNTELLENSKVTRQILEAMFMATEPPGKGGAHRVVPSSK